VRPPPHACLSTTHRNTSAALRRCDCPPGNPVLLGSPTAEDHDLVALHPGRSVGRGKFIDAFDHIGCIVPCPTDVTALRGNDRIPKRELCVPPIDDIAAITLYRPGENGPFVILALWVGRRDVDPRRDSSENLELRVEPIPAVSRFVPTSCSRDSNFRRERKCLNPCRSRSKMPALSAVMPGTIADQSPRRTSTHLA
jgi:hypothetical protein